MFYEAAFRVSSVFTENGRIIVRKTIDMLHATRLFVTSAFKIYIVPKTRIDIEHMRNILLVLQKLDEVLLYYRTHNLTKRVSQKKKDYAYFIEFPRLTDNEAPGTGICCYVSRYVLDVVIMLDKRFENT